jgi:hypothetical protein
MEVEWVEWLGGWLAVEWFWELAGRGGPAVRLLNRQ